MSELKPCPFCGGAAHFFKITDLDDRNFGGDGICCGSCPVTTDLMFSLMEDCKPKLAEAWNRRAQPAQAGQALSDEDVLRAAARTLDSEVVEVSPLSCIKDFARAIEQAVMAKRVPMMREEVKELARKVGYDNATAQERADFINGIRHAEVWHGIVGDKGGA